MGHAPRRRGGPGGVPRRPDARARGGGAVEPRPGDAGLIDTDPIAARRAAFQVLEETAAGRPFDAALGRALSGLDARDGRLTHELAAGVLRRRGDLDLALAPLTEHGWESVAPRVRTVLRLGAYQLLELDKVPAHAAVGTSTDLARWAAGEPAARFVNAVLRRLAREGGPVAAAPGSRRSHPAWLLHRWDQRFGVEATDRLLLWNDSQPPLVLQPARATQAAITAELAGHGIASEDAPWGAGLVVDASRPADLPRFAEGDFIVQDAAQALVARYAAIPDGATVLDACAAPGGKAIALGRSARRVLAADLRPARVRRLRENLARAGSGREHAIVADAAHPACRNVDAALLDAPCLGTGTFARHPDARWRVNASALARLAAQQAILLEAVARVVRPGGLLVYATCSLEPEENGLQMARFLNDHPEFTREPPAEFPAELLSPAGDLELLPQVHGIDGAFAARLRRRAA
ncbi:MAG TPA: transcription antitermination factor NusB [Gemmatimonadales bacterium]|nr:transcription antitermination factor NusB [Gemmatimonadales bacterium]